MHENDRKTAVDVVKCILAEIVYENKHDVISFDIDKIDADAKEVERKYNETLKNIEQQYEENNKKEVITNEH